VKEYLDHILPRRRKTGVAKTLFGRIRPIPEIKSQQMQLRILRNARRSIAIARHGGRSHQLAMINIDARLADEKFEARMILQVHRRTALRNTAKGTQQAGETS